MLGISQQKFSKRKLFLYALDSHTVTRSDTAGETKICVLSSINLEIHKQEQLQQHCSGMNQLPPVLTGNVNYAHSLTNPTHQTALNGLTHRVHNVSSHLTYSKLYWNVQHFHSVLDNFCLQLFQFNQLHN